MSLHHLSLLNMGKTDPGISKRFERNALSVRRTKHFFSRSAVEITLEQIMNQDAASRHGGIPFFKENVRARKRWTVTSSFRGGTCKLFAGNGWSHTQVQQDAGSKTLQNRKRDNTDLSSAISELENTLNLFTIHDTLFCLTTGKAVSDSVKDDILHLKEFVNKRQRGCWTFWKAIKWRKVKNIAQKAVEIKVTTKDRQIREVKCIRDLFGRQLYLVVSLKLDLDVVLSYPQTSVSLSLSYHW